MESDDKIIEAMRSDPERGLLLMMKAYEERIYWHIRRLVISHEDAQDAAQETFIRAYNAFHSFRGHSSVSTWLFRIATNEALRQIRRRKDSDSLEGSGAFEAISGFWTDWTDHDTVKFQKAILSLPRKQQLCFNLRYYDEMEYEEIARITGSTSKSAKANYHNAKEKIIHYMNEND